MTGLLTAVLYVIKDFAALVGIFMVMRFIFLERYDLSIGKIICIALLTVLNSAAGVLLIQKHTSDFDSVMDFISDIIALLAIFLVFGKSSPIRKIITWFIYIYTCDMMWALLAHYIGMNLLTEYAVHIVIFAAVGISVYLFSSKFNDNILPMVFGKVPTFAYILILLFELTCYFREYGASEQWYNVMYTVSSVGIIACVLYILFKIFRMSYEQGKILEQLSVQSDQIERVRENDEELRRFRHDYKNHMAVVSCLLESGRTKEASEYLDSVTGRDSKTQQVIKTGNFTADAIINSKASSGQKENIVIDFTGFIPPDGISSKDICTVLSNLLDNAIEASEKVDDKRIITIEANMSYGNFILSISNPATGVKTDKDGKIATSKLDKKNHGIGLRNVERTVEKYKGAFMTEFDNGIFTADVRMKIV